MIPHNRVRDDFRIGDFPDVTVSAHGDVYLAYSRDHTLFFHVIDPVTLQDRKPVQTLSCSSLAFPRLSSNRLIYRGPDLETSPALFRDLNDGWETPLGPTWGNHPVALSYTTVCWQDLSGDVMRVRVGDESSLRAAWATAVKESTGLSRQATGLASVVWDPEQMQERPTFWDEEYQSVPGLTVPHRAGPILVGQHPNGGVVCRRTAQGADFPTGVEVKEFVLWPGEATYEPRVCEYREAPGSALARSSWFVVAAAETGIRCAKLEWSDWDAAPPVVDPPPLVVPLLGDRLFFYFWDDPSIDLPRNATTKNLADGIGVILVDGSPIASFAGGGNPQQLRERAGIARQHASPVIGIADGFWPAGQPEWPVDVDILALELYPWRGMTERADRIGVRVRAALQTFGAHRRFLLVVKQYRNPGETYPRHELPRILQAAVAIAAEDPRVLGFGIFSGPARQGGVADHPELLPLHRAVFARISKRPTLSNIPHSGETTMQIPARVLAVARALWERRPPQSEDDSRDFMRRLAEHLKFETGERWGVKRAGPGRPLSKDLLPRAVAGGFEGWDLILGSGSPSSAIAENPSYLSPGELAGQIFEDVEAKNHLGVEPQPQPQPQPPPNPPTGDLETRLLKIERDILALANTSRETAKRVDTIIQAIRNA